MFQRRFLMTGGLLAKSKGWYQVEQDRPQSARNVLQGQTLHCYRYSGTTVDRKKRETDVYSFFGESVDLPTLNTRTSQALCNRCNALGSDIDAYTMARHQCGGTFVFEQAPLLEQAFEALDPKPVRPGADFESVLGQVLRRMPFRL